MAFSSRRLLLPALVFAVNAWAPGTSRSQDGANGIVVGRPKVFDNRSLVIMLDSLNERLRTIQTVESKPLLDSMTHLQGYQSREVARALDVLGIGTPGVKTTLKPDASGTLQPAEQTVDQSAVSPRMPELPAILTPPAFEPKFGSSGADLLSDQLNLAYQIFNVRMLLERSLTDRLWNPAGGTAGPRLQTVLGFNVTLEPPDPYRDNAAIVEVTVAPKTGSDPVSLVALMPLEKTYNSAALHTKASAFGGSAVAKILTVGYSERRRGQTFYLFRDSDTIALERLNNPARSPETAITFGWQFRPVLGRRAVSPGARQLFAVLALPAGDSVSDTSSVQALDVSVRTYWLRYSQKTLTTSTLDRGVVSYPLCPKAGCSVPTTANAQEQLRPKVKLVTWVATDEKTAVVNVEGDNLFPGTAVLIGGTNHDSAERGLLIKSDHALQVQTSLAALATADAVLNGRYGPSGALVVDPCNGRTCGIAINAIYLKTSAGRSLTDIDVKLQMGPGKPLPRAQLPEGFTPLVTDRCVVLSTSAPTALFKDDAHLTVRTPFWGRDFQDSRVVHIPAASVQVTRLGSNETIARLALTGEGFGTDWIVRADNDYFPNVSPNLKLTGNSLMNLDLPIAVLAGLKNLVVIPPAGKGRPVIVAIPGETPAPAKAAIDNSKPPHVAQDTSAGVVLAGKALGAVKRVSFEKDDLSYEVSKDGNSMTVFVTRALTAKPGIVQVLLRTDDAVLPASIVIDRPASP
jgi:hypothetical protein